MKVLITGGAGFIGSHLNDHLLARGDEVLTIDNYATARRDNLTPHDNLRIIEGDIANQELVQSIFADFRPEVVVHAAASYKDPNNWVEDIKTNTLGTAHVVQACQGEKIQRLIYFQTSLCYGLMPLEQPITLSHPIRPEGSSYAISKTAAEQYIQLSGLDYISFRLANVCGPRGLSGPLPTFYQRLSNKLKCFVVDTKRDFMFIQDLVDIVTMAIDGKGERGAYHVSSGSDYSIKELFDAVVKVMGITLDEEVEVRPRNPDDAPTILLDPSKTNQDFGWKATISLEAGVHETIEYYREYGVTETYTHLKMKE
jgi:UDP-glucose 4-epimerase